MTLTRKNSVKVTGKVQNWCPVHILLIGKHWKILLHTQIAYDLRVCHHPDSRSLRQGQGHCPENCKTRFRSMFLMEKHWEFLLHMQIAYDLRLCHDLDSSVCVCVCVRACVSGLVYVYQHLKTFNRCWTSGLSFYFSPVCYHRNAGVFQLQR